MKSTKTKIQCKPCKTFITEKNYPNHLKSFTHIQKILPNIIITTPEGKSTIYNFRTNTKCLMPFYSPCNGVNLWQRNTCSNSCSKMLITLLAIATELHLLFSNKRTIHINSIESVVKMHNPLFLNNRTNYIDFKDLDRVFNNIYC